MSTSSAQDFWSSLWTITRTIEGLQVHDIDKSQWLGLLSSFHHLMAVFTHIKMEPSFDEETDAEILTNAWRTLFFVLTPRQVANNLRAVHNHPIEGFIPASHFSTARLPEYAFIIIEILVYDAWELLFRFGSDEDSEVAGDILLMEDELKKGLGIVLGLGEGWDMAFGGIGMGRRHQNERLDQLVAGMGGLNVETNSEVDSERIAGMLDMMRF